jgi:hypothetical protein
MHSKDALPNILLGIAITVVGTAGANAETRPANADALEPTESAQVSSNRPTPGSRLVGLWRNQITIAPCSGGAPTTFVGYNTFHGGGTLTEFNLQPPATRTVGSGQWRDYGGGIFDVHFQFARFNAAGGFDGMQDVQAALDVDPRGRRSTGTVRAQVLNVDGSLRVELCGTLQGERVNLLPR